jgi:hypothetical protein
MNADQGDRGGDRSWLCKKNTHNWELGGNELCPLGSFSSFLFYCAMDLDDPQQKGLSYTDQQVYDKSTQFSYSIPHSDPFPLNPILARSMSQHLLTAAIALKSAKDDYAAIDQAHGLLHDPSQRESIVDEVRKAWENGNLESLLDSGMW